MKTGNFLATVGVIALALSTTARADGLVTFQQLSPDTALKLAKAALDSCRENDLQVAVAVVNRSGDLQVILRDQYAGAHTPETARRKAWTSVSFREATLELAKDTQAGSIASGVRFVTDALMLGGGVPVEAAGRIVGGVGVSGAPTGDMDDACARVGIEAVIEDIEF